MSTDVLSHPIIDTTTTAVVVEDPFDLDVEVSTQEVSFSSTITSKFLCTGGCTSPGGGSFCSWCC